jgi:hypothetical protein
MLIEELSRYDEDAIVRLAFQPSWPLEYSVGAVVEVEVGDHDYSHEEIEEARAEGVDLMADEETETIVYIGEREQLGYLSGSAQDALNW